MPKQQNADKSLYHKTHCLIYCPTASADCNLSSQLKWSFEWFCVTSKYFGFPHFIAPLLGFALLGNSSYKTWPKSIDSIIRWCSVVSEVCNFALKQEVDVRGFPLPQWPAQQDGTESVDDTKGCLAFFPLSAGHGNLRACVTFQTQSRWRQRNKECLRLCKEYWYTILLSNH